MNFIKNTTLTLSLLLLIIGNTTFAMLITHEIYGTTLTELDACTNEDAFYDKLAEITLSSFHKEIQENSDIAQKISDSFKKEKAPDSDTTIYSFYVETRQEAHDKLQASEHVVNNNAREEIEFLINTINDKVVTMIKGCIEIMLSRLIVD